jgi:hypothetical protein
MQRYLLAICLVLLVGCASKQKTDTTQASSSSKPDSTSKASTPNGRVVKSKDGTIEGEIVGTPAPKSKFSKLQIGMTPEEVEKLIGPADDTDSHMTGKAFIPFHFGGDKRRLEAFYKREGQLTFSNTNNFVAPNALIKIEVNTKATGISK